MKWFLFFSLLLPFQNIAFTQQNTRSNNKIFKVSIYDQQSQNHQGYLQNMEEGSLTVNQAPLKYGEPGKGKLIQYPDISSMTIKRKGNAVRGIIIGALSGFLIGTIIGYASGDDLAIPANEDFFGIGNAFRLTAGQKAIGGGILLAGAGAAVGGVTGVTGALVKKKFTINGKKENFEAMRMQTLEKIYAPAKK